MPQREAKLRKPELLRVAESASSTVERSWGLKRRSASMVSTWDAYYSGLEISCTITGRSHIRSCIGKAGLDAASQPSDHKICDPNHSTDFGSQ